jgi:hypothetical protein
MRPPAVHPDGSLQSPLVPVKCNGRCSSCVRSLEDGLEVHQCAARTVYDQLSPQSKPCVLRIYLGVNKVRALQRECWAARNLFQADNTVCLAFLPYRSTDYEEMWANTDKRRREGFADARDRCIESGGPLSTEGEPWDYQGLKGAHH